MKYLDIDTVCAAFEEIRSCTSNKFWGVMAILSAIDSNVEPGKTYLFNTQKCGRFLDQIFTIDDYPEFTTSSATRYVKFSKKWAFIVSDRLLITTPSIYFIAVWALRKHRFNDDANENTIVYEFLSKCHLRPQEAAKMFKMDRRHIQFSCSLYSDNTLWRLLPIVNRAFRHLKADGDCVKAKPGEMSRGPFLQPLYASQDNLDCMIITKFDIDSLYGNPKV